MRTHKNPRSKPWGTTIVVIMSVVNTTSPMQLLSVTVQRGNAEMYRRSGPVISGGQGFRYDAGFAVPVLPSTVLTA